jgi:hypothetical protein
MTEMSMGRIEENVVDGALGIGIFCGDYSMCAIEDNVVRDVRPDTSSNDAGRQGVAIESHFGAKAELAGNEITGTPIHVAAYSGATAEHE